MSKVVVTQWLREGEQAVDLTAGPSRVVDVLSMIRPMSYQDQVGVLREFLDRTVH